MSERAIKYLLDKYKDAFMKNIINISTVMISLLAVSFISVSGVVSVLYIMSILKDFFS
jgi:hypothetical protein